jgi:phosphatidylglycerol:prolipoprotein diacylglycerol transferase
LLHLPIGGLVAAAGVLAALFLSGLTARREGLNPEKVWNLNYICFLTALIGSRLLLILLNRSDFRAHPLWMLGVTSVRSLPAMLGATALAISAGIAYTRAVGLPFRRTLDALAPPIALVALSFSLSAMIHPRVASTKTVGDCIADGVLLLVIVAVFFPPSSGASKRLFYQGEKMGLWLFLYGVSSFALDLLPGGGASNPAFAGLLSTPQILAVCMVIAGGMLWLLPARSSSSAGMVSSTHGS